MSISYIACRLTTSLILMQYMHVCKALQFVCSLQTYPKMHQPFLQFLPLICEILKVTRIDMDVGKDRRRRRWKSRTKNR